jgi:hypothetical protein
MYDDMGYEDWSETEATVDMGCERCGRPERSWVHFFGHGYRSPKLKKMKDKGEIGCFTCGKPKREHGFFSHAFVPPKTRAKGKVKR